MLPASQPADNGGADAASAHLDAAERDEILKGGGTELAFGGNSPRTRFNGGTAQEGTAGSVGSATPVRSGRHRDFANSHDPTTAAEARRKVVALAEALARQAAREDDAAENAKERPRSPQDVPAEELPSRDAKDDMS